MNLFKKQKQNYKYRKQTYDYLRMGGGRRGVNWEIGTDIYIVL